MTKSPKLLTFFYAIALCTFSSAALAWGEPKVGVAPGKMEVVEYVIGGEVKFEKYLGAPVFVYFGADWCPPCVATSRPAVVKAIEKFKSRGFQVLYINLDDNSTREKRIKEAAALGIDIAMLKVADYPVGKFLAGPRLSQLQFGDFGKFYFVPAGLLIDEKGIARFKYEKAGQIAFELDNNIASLLDKK